MCFKQTLNAEARQARCSISIQAAHCPMRSAVAAAALTEAIAAPGAMERTAKMAEAKMIFMILFD